MKKSGCVAFSTVLMLGVLILTGLCPNAKAANLPQKDAILVGWVAPFTGPLAQFTQSTKFIEAKALAEMNKNGGIYVEEYKRKLPVKIIWADSESNPTKASEAANKLVLSNKVDFLIASWTPDTINPVSAVAERHKIPALMENGPIESWMTGGPYKWANGDLFSLENMVDTYIAAWDTVKTNKKVGFVYDNQVDGILLSKLNRQRAEARGYTIIDPGRFPAGTKDYTSIISQFKKAGVDIVVANMITPDFAVALKQFHQQGFVPKIFTIGKGLCFRSDASSLGGDLGNGLLAEDHWEPSFPFKSSLTGQTAAGLSAEWAKTGKYPDATLGYDMSTFDVLADVLTRAKSLDREKLRKALSETDLNTMFGHIKYDRRNIAEVPLVVSQWVRGKNGAWEKHIVANGKFTKVPLAKEKLFFLAGSK